MQKVCTVVYENQQCKTNAKWDQVDLEVDPLSKPSIYPLYKQFYEAGYLCTAKSFLHCRMYRRNWNINFIGTELSTAHMSDTS
jgi:hypothetical protein